MNITTNIHDVTSIRIEDRWPGASYYYRTIVIQTSDGTYDIGIFSPDASALELDSDTAELAALKAERDALQERLDEIDPQLNWEPARAAEIVEVPK